MGEYVYSWTWSKSDGSAKRYKFRITDFAGRVNHILREELKRMRVPYRSSEGRIIVNSK